MSFFKPWGRDFVIIRSVNKRTRAAYFEYLKRLVGISAYIKTIDDSVLQESRDKVDEFLRYADEGVFKDRGLD